jgi:excisionase family DNA binding protein
VRKKPCEVGALTSLIVALDGDCVHRAKRSVPASGKRHGGDDMSGRMSIPEIANRLSVGRLAVYTMLERGIIPAVRLGRRWIVTRHAFDNWERTCGVPTGLQRLPEHKVT